MSSLLIMALYSNMAMLMGSAKVRETIQSISSIALPAAKFFGQSLIFSNKAFPIAGKKRTGRGRTNLERAVSMMAFFPAAILLPY